MVVIVIVIVVVIVIVIVLVLAVVIEILIVIVIVNLQHGPVAIVPVLHCAHALPPSVPCDERHLQAEALLWELHVPQHVQVVYAQPPGERVQVLRQGIASTQLAHDRVGSLEAASRHRLHEK